METIYGSKIVENTLYVYLSAEINGKCFSEYGVKNISSLKKKEIRFAENELRECLHERLNKKISFFKQKNNKQKNESNTSS